MAPGVIADHVAVSEHLPLDRAVRVVRRDVLADLEECRRRVQASQFIDEVRRRRLPPWTVVERERDVVNIAGTGEHPIRPARDAADQTRSVERRQQRPRREQCRARRGAGDRGRTTPRAHRADHLPAELAIRKPDARGQEAGGQLPVARPVDGRRDRHGGTGAGARDRRVEQPGRPFAAHRPRETNLNDDGACRGVLEQEAQRAAIAMHRRGRERLDECDLPHQILTVLAERRRPDRQRRADHAARARHAARACHAARGAHPAYGGEDRHEADYDDQRSATHERPPRIAQPYYGTGHRLRRRVI